MTSKTTRVHFVQDAKIDRGAGDVRKFKKGETYDLSHDHAQRWIVRGKAVLASDAATVAAALPIAPQAPAPVAPVQTPPPPPEAASEPTPAQEPAETPPTAEGPSEQPVPVAEQPSSNSRASRRSSTQK